MKYTKKLNLVCAKEVSFEIDDQGKLSHVEFVAGCNGNLKAIGRLVEGHDAAEIATLLEGNDCKGRGTSCADQFSKVLKSI